MADGGRKNPRSLVLSDNFKPNGPPDAPEKLPCGPFLFFFLIILSWVKKWVALS